MAAAAPVKVMQSLFSTRHDGDRSVCPMELRADMIEAYWWALAAKQATFTVTHLPAQEPANLFTQIGNMRPCRRAGWTECPSSSADGRTDRVGAGFAPRREGATERGQPGHLPRRCSCATMKDHPQDKQAKGKQDDGHRKSISYHEADCASLSYYDAGASGFPLSVSAACPSTTRPTLKAMLAAETAFILEVKIAEGATHNWT
jgi:hypothetical protein